MWIKRLAGMACLQTGADALPARPSGTEPGLTPHHLAGRWSWWQPHAVMCRHGRGTGVHGDGSSPNWLVRPEQSSSLFL